MDFYLQDLKRYEKKTKKTKKNVSHWLVDRVVYIRNSAVPRNECVRHIR